MRGALSTHFPKVGYRLKLEMTDEFGNRKKNPLSFLVIYALSDFLIMILSWLVKQSLRAFLFQEVQP